MRPMKKVLRVAVMALLTGCSASRTASFRTDYLGIDINEKGYIVGLWNTTRSDSRNFSPADSTKRMAVALSNLELAGKASLRDLFTHAKMKAVKDSIVADVGPHDVKIFRVAGQKRLEPVCYEAEWAYLPLYNDLGKRKKEIFYASDEKASGGRVVRYAGGRRENSIIWDGVWSDQGGLYEMTIDYTPAANRGLEVIVNGESTIGPLTDSTSATISIKLRAGYNTVEMTSRTTWTPDIDRFTLRRTE